MKIGLALGGGGARGLAHIGVIKVLEEEGIKIDYIAGTSMGAIIGAMYAQNPNAEGVIKRLKLFLQSTDYDALGVKYFFPKREKTLSFIQFLYKGLRERFSIELSPRRKGLIKRERLDYALSFLIDEGDIENTIIPFAAVSTDLSRGKTVAFRKGDIRKAVRISASIPGIIPPELESGMALVDGGVTEPVPVYAVKEMGADFVIAVDVSVTQLDNFVNPSIIDIIARTETVRGIYLSGELVKHADFVFHPDLKDAHWSEFLRYEEFIQEGIDEGKGKVNELKKQLRKYRSFWRRLWRNRC
ncbi:MAG: hypothetical protein DRP91_05255 [Candidatus Neomarinimicrobiota bacterium]|nr:MAG: hypothetical protein DRP91_05255 [Candidatus Neomarinimicrobiota bacterium]